MRGTDMVGIVGGGLLVAGVVFGIADTKLFDHWYDWVFGPLFWMMGCTMMIAWIFERLYPRIEQPRLKQRRTGTDFIRAAETPLEHIQRQAPERRREERRHEERRKSPLAA